MNTGRADVSALQFLLTHTDYGRPEFVNAPMRIEQASGEISERKITSNIMEIVNS